MASFFAETMTSLRAQIKGMMTCTRSGILRLVLTLRPDDFRFVYGIYEEEPIVAIATHDNLYWVIVHAKKSPHTYTSDNGHKSEGDALQDMAKGLSDKVWKMAKDTHITLPK